MKKSIFALFLLSFTIFRSSNAESRFDQIIQLSSGGAGSHLLNLYIAKILDTDVNVLSSKGVKPYKRINDKFSLSHNEALPTFMRSHNPGAIDQNEKNLLIVLVRDYKEVFFHKLSNCSEKCYKENGRHFPSFIENYFDILSFYDNWEKDKVMVYYEDLITDPVAALTPIFEALEIIDSSLNDKIEATYRLSKEIFQIYPGSAYSRGKSLHFHSEKRSLELIKKMDAKVAVIYPDLFEKYLTQYSAAK